MYMFSGGGCRCSLLTEKLILSLATSTASMLLQPEGTRYMIDNDKNQYIIIILKIVLSMSDGADV